MHILCNLHSLTICKSHEINWDYMRLYESRIPTRVVVLLKKEERNYVKGYSIKDKIYERHYSGILKLSVYHVGCMLWTQCIRYQGSTLGGCNYLLHASMVFLRLWLMNMGGTHYIFTKWIEGRPSPNTTFISMRQSPCMFAVWTCALLIGIIMVQ